MAYAWGESCVARHEYDYMKNFFQQLHVLHIKSQSIRIRYIFYSKHNKKTIEPTRVIYTLEMLWGYHS